MGRWPGASGAGAIALVLACAACAAPRDRDSSPGLPDPDAAKEPKKEKPRETRRDRAARHREESKEKAASKEIEGGAAAAKGSPWRAHGVFDLVVKNQATSGRIARDGVSDSTTGSPRSQVYALDLDLLFDRWMISHELSTTFLPASLDIQGNSLLATTRSHYGNWDLVLGPKILEIPAESPGVDEDAVPRRGRGPAPVFRLDAFAGIRSHRFSEWKNLLGILPVSRGSFGWRDPVAGIRAEWMATEDVAIRLRGDTKFSGTGSDDAWRASLAAVFWASRRASLTLGWEFNSIHYEKGRGRGADVYDLRLSGPFLALEIRF